MEFTSSNHSILMLNDYHVGETFTIPMPPPNITGRLHMGHALDLSLQDCLIRYYEQRGANTRWVQGFDHAGLATHDKLMSHYPNLKWNNDLDIQKYQDLANSWVADHKLIIDQQFKALHPRTTGDSRFTLDSEYQIHVRTSLEKLKNNLYWKDGSLMLNMSDARSALMAALGKDIKCSPAGHENRLKSMLNEDIDWDIGRSIPWGTAIPEWCHIMPGANDNQITLDTWFNSALWPSAIHPNEKTPISVLITGYDILFFWCARMAMIHWMLYGSWPFSTIKLHGLIRDKEGQKFSKSLGNGVDPLDIIHTDGSDALRIWCLTNARWGRDIKFDINSLQGSNALPTKMLNATRYLLNCKPTETLALETEDLSFLNLDSDLDSLMHDAELDQAFVLMKKFAWMEWCEGWMTRNKTAIQTDYSTWSKAMFYHQSILTRLHPFMPMTTWWLTKHCQ